jgi:hypothetical protein
MASDSRAVPGWFPDEIVHSGRENLDAGHVARYDAKEDADAEHEVELLQAAGLNRAWRVVDLHLAARADHPPQRLRRHRERALRRRHLGEVPAARALAGRRTQAGDELVEHPA